MVISKIANASRAIFDGQNPPKDKTATDAPEVVVPVRDASQILPASRRWAALGLDSNKVLASVYGHIARAEECRKVLHDRRDQLRNELEDARRAFSEGTIELDELDRIAAAFDRIDDAQSSLSRSLNAAVAVAFSTGEREFSQAIEEQVWPFLVTGATNAAARSAELARDIPAYVNTREQAREEGFSEAWGQLSGLVATWDAFHIERTTLTRLGLFPGLDNLYGLLPGAQGGAFGLTSNAVHAFPLWLRFRYPEKLPPTFYSEVQPEMRLAIAGRVGAEPGMYSVGTATANIVVWRERVLSLSRADAIGAVMALPGVSTAGALGLIGTRTADTVQVS